MSGYWNVLYRCVTSIDEVTSLISLHWEGHDWKLASFPLSEKIKRKDGVECEEALIKPQSSGTALGSTTWPKPHWQMIEGFFTFLVSLWVTDKQQCGRVTAQPRPFTSKIPLVTSTFSALFIQGCSHRCWSKAYYRKGFGAPVTLLL